ncbi:uncharacterized protein VTP21DRAFT_4015 [Calcarisporiella thermophila]|uniref:uncharacterized protein n=1 Tax=Calcarisporiella thermophila TaxID=911321 RepID=UPI0037420CB1
MSVTTTTTATNTSHATRKPQKQEPLFDKPITLNNWYKYVNWLHCVILIGTPLASLYGVFTTQLHMKTLIWAVVYYFYTALGITGGYHRLWSHRAYNAHPLLEIFYCLGGAGAVQGSIRWWSRGHRAHHRYTDTDKDPYSAHRGLLWSHMGWMLLKRGKSIKIGYADVADLDANPIVRFQHKYYGLFAIGMGYIFPMLVAGLGWGDWRGGYFYAGTLRLCFVHHATFCVNSLAHYLGEATFDDRRSPRDHFLTALVTMGEGYHNFHHEFPNDYRNAIRFYQYDPTKWFITVCHFLGLAYNLKKFPENEVQKGRINMLQKKLDMKKAKLTWGVPLSTLPVITYEEFQRMCEKENRALIVIEGIVHDVAAFIDEHPGGRSLILTGIGKDMTTAFNGGSYNHSNAARNLMSHMRVAIIQGGMELEANKAEKAHH